jgi:hypothetical protein
MIDTVNFELSMRFIVRLSVMIKCQNQSSLTLTPLGAGINCFWICHGEFAQQTTVRIYF